MIEHTRFLIQKDIPLGGGDVIMKGRELQYTHGIFYLDGGLLSRDYQEDFHNLIEKEQKNGWNYVVPIRTVNHKSII